MNSKQHFISQTAAIATAIYVASNIFANILSVKIISLPLLYPFNEVDAGVIIFPIAFIVRDILHKNAGKKIAATVVISTAGINIAMVLLFHFVAILPPAPYWQASGAQEAFSMIIVPASRIALASIIAQILSGLFNTHVFSRIIRQNPEKKDIIASLISNLLAITLDTIIFTLIAFASPITPMETLLSIIVVNIAFKVLIAIIGAPTVRFIKIQVDKDLL
ncbi:queuosine precursor transporter [Entomospira entomophila]|uniref:Queuosine precursor transporter n=1 Tax=Entomospira entomophila TaxID=2719988 RepID=A0A968KTH0_9SPIO|nr:queuosine precursor transporter [Entomospira entomophilus]NIZ40306.1 queuosine precursor transporter [Entomospira entomophilus]WDI35865.1 queuosine precursor transporter [Entomospira entomophilus]